jgi:hypothetical protein
LSHLIISTFIIRFLYLSSNILSQSDISMLRLIVSSDWSNEWCRSNEDVSEILRAFVETALWWNRLLTSLQSSINSHWFDSSESLFSISVYEYQHASTLYQVLAFLFSTREEFDDYRNVCATSSSCYIELTWKIVFIRLFFSRFDLKSIILSRCWTSSSWLVWQRVNQSNYHTTWRDNRLSSFWWAYCLRTQLRS